MTDRDTVFHAANNLVGLVCDVTAGLFEGAAHALRRQARDHYQAIRTTRTARARNSK